MTAADNRLGAQDDGVASLGRGAPRLARLDVAGNGLGPRLPWVAEPGLLAHLLRLDLARNVIAAIDGRELSACAPNLEALILSHNRLAVFPSELALPRLEGLWLSGNALVSLGGDAWLPRLRELHAANNRVEALGRFLVGAPTLETLDLSHNALDRGGQLAASLAFAKRALQRPEAATTFERFWVENQ